MEDPNKKNQKSILFVCLGNLCRSPIAEAVFLETIRDAGTVDDWIVDSAGIGSWYVGRNPDVRATETIRNHDIRYNNVAQQVTSKHFDNFDYIVAVHTDIIDSLMDIAPRNSHAKMLLLGDFDPQGERNMRDPFYDDDCDGFEKIYRQSVRCCQEFLEKVKANKL